MPFREEGLRGSWSEGVFASNESDDNTYYFRGKTTPFQTLKLSPHEQLALALGLENLKPPATILAE